MQDGAVLANSGHFDAELELAALERLAEGHIREVRENVQEYDLGEKKLYLLAEGRLVNLGAAEGHPAAVMDMSFAGQALSAEYVARNHESLEKRRPRRARRDRRADRTPQAGGARHLHRGHDRGADQVHQLLGPGHLIGRTGRGRAASAGEATHGS